MSYQDKVVLGDCVLYLGDCLEVMKDIPDKSVDAVITDPPYGISYMGGIAVERERLANDKDAKIYAQFVPIVFRVMKNGGTAYIFYATSYSHEVYPIIYDNFRKYQQLIWQKTNVTFGNPFARYKFDYEPLIYCCKGSPSTWNGGSKERAILRFKRDSDAGNLHPTQKPIGLIERLILNSSNESDVILDPFMGSGTSGIACIHTNRKFIGIEIDQKYFEIACKRIKDAQQQMRLPL